MNQYEKNRVWSERFMPEVKNIVGGYLLESSSLQMDTQRVTDLVLVRARDLLIAVRMRKYGYAQRYPWDFTIRSRIRYDKTEWDKIIDGWGGWMFYGHADESEQKIARWLLVDLMALRAALVREPLLKTKPDVPNGDGTWFKAFDVRKLAHFNPSILVGSSHKTPAVQMELI